MTIEKYNVEETVAPLVLNLPLHLHDISVEIHVANLLSSSIAALSGNAGVSFIQLKSIYTFILHYMTGHMESNNSQELTAIFDLLFLVLVTFGWVVEEYYAVGGY
jgi:hypothetical protein